MRKALIRKTLVSMALISWLIPADLWARFDILSPSTMQTYGRLNPTACSGIVTGNNVPLPMAATVGFGVMNPLTGDVANQNSVAVLAVVFPNAPGAFWAANIPAPAAPGWTPSVIINVPLPFPPFFFPQLVPDKGFRTDDGFDIVTKGTHMVF